MELRYYAAVLRSETISPFHGRFFSGQFLITWSFTPINSSCNYNYVILRVIFAIYWSISRTRFFTCEIFRGGKHRVTPTAMRYKILKFRREQKREGSFFGSNDYCALSRDLDTRVRDETASGLTSRSLPKNDQGARHEFPSKSPFLQLFIGLFIESRSNRVSVSLSINLHRRR